MNESKDAFHSLKTNSRQSPISQLKRVFSRRLKKDCIMSNCKYLIENNILYSKQFGFQDGHSTEHALVLLGKQIIESMLNKRLRHLLPYQRILTLETTPFFS